MNVKVTDVHMYVQANEHLCDFEQRVYAINFFLQIAIILIRFFDFGIWHKFI